MSEEVAKLTAIFEAHTSQVDVATAKVDAELKATAVTAEVSAAKVSASFNAMGASANSFTPTIARMAAAEGTAAQRAEAFAQARAKWTAEYKAAAPAGYAHVTMTNMQTAATNTAATALNSVTVSHTNAGAAAKKGAKDLGEHTTAANQAQGVLGKLQHVLHEVSTGTKPINKEFSESLHAITPAATSVSTALGAIATPAGIAVVSIAAVAAITVGAALGMYELAHSSAEAAGPMFDLSQKTGVTVENLSALETLSLQTGGTLAGTATALGILEKKLEDVAENGTSRLSKGLKQLGIDVDDPNKSFVQLFDILGKLPNGIARVGLSMQIFGRSGKDINAMIEETGGNFEEAKKRLEEYGIVLGTDSAKKADVFLDELVLVEKQVAALKRQIGEALLPAVLGGLKDISTWLKDNQKEILEWGRVFTKTLEVILGTTKVLAEFLYHAFLEPIVITFKAVYWGFDKLAGLVDTVPHAPTYPAGANPQPMPTPKTSTYSGPTTSYEDSVKAGYAPFLASGQQDSIDKASAAEEKKAQDAAKKLRELFSQKGGGGGGGAESAAQAASKLALDLAQVELQTAETMYRDLLDKERSFYSQSLTSMEAYSRARITAENNRYDAELAVFEKEQSILDTGKFKKGDKELKQAQLDQKTLAGRLTHESTLRQIKEDSDKAAEDADRKHASALISLQDETLRTLEVNIARAVEGGKLSPVEAENQRFDAEAGIYKAKVTQLQKDIDDLMSKILAAGRGGDSNKITELTDQYDILIEQQDRAFQEHVGRLYSARRQEIEDTQRYAQELTSIMRSTADMETDTAELRIEALLRYSTSVEEQARAEERLATEAERRSRQRLIQDLNDRKFYIEQLRQLGLIKEREAVGQEKAITEQIEAIERNSAQKILSIHEEAQQKIYDHYRDLSRDLADIIQSAFDKGFEGVLDSAKSFFSALSREILEAGILHALQPNAPNQSQAGGLLGGITNAILGKFGLLNRGGGPQDLGGGSVYVPGGTGATRGRTVTGDLEAIAGPLGGKMASLGGAISASTQQQTTALTNATVTQTEQLASQIQAAVEHMCACSKPAEQGNGLQGILGEALGALPDLLRHHPTKGPRGSAPGGVYEVNPDDTRGGRLDAGGGGTRPRRVFEPDAVDTQGRVVGAVDRNTDKNVRATEGQTDSLAQEMRDNTEYLAQALAPVQQGFLEGLLGAALSGAMSGLTSSLMSGGGGSDNEAGGGPSSGGPPVRKPFKPRARGGPVFSGEEYLVGEHGPEILKMGNHPGNVIPNYAAFPKDSGSKEKKVTVNINVQDKRGGSYSNPKSDREMAEQIAASIQQHLS